MRKNTNDLLEVYEKFKQKSKVSASNIDKGDVEYIYEDKKIKLKLTPKSIYGKNMKHKEGFGVDSIKSSLAIKFKE